MDATHGNLLEMPLRVPSPKTTLRRNQFISVWSPIAKEIALSIAARNPSCEACDMVQIALLVLTECAGGVDAYVRQKIEGALKNSVDANRRAGRAAKESKHERIEPGEDMGIRDAGASAEDALIAREKIGLVRKAVASLPHPHRNV